MNNYDFAGRNKKIDAAKASIYAYQMGAGIEREVNQESIIRLIIDLLHVADQDLLDSFEVVSIAYTVFIKEKKEDYEDKNNSEAI